MVQLAEQLTEAEGYNQMDELHLERHEENLRTLEDEKVIFYFKRNLIYYYFFISPTYNIMKNRIF